MLGPGDAVLLYTDGLVERRDDGIDSRLEQLRAAVAAAPDELAAALEHLTATLVGDDALRQDDVALLALRVAPTPDTPFTAADRARAPTSSPRCAATCAAGSPPRAPPSASPATC